MKQFGKDDTAKTFIPGGSAAVPALKAFQTGSTLQVRVLHAGDANSLH